MLILIQIILSTILLICLWADELISSKNFLFKKIKKYITYFGTGIVLIQLLINIILSVLI